MWLDKVDSITQTSEKKLTALALCNLLPTNDTQLLKYLGQVINICVSVMHSEKEQKEGNFEHWNNETIIPVYSVALEQLLKSDPVQHINMHTFLMQKLNETALMNPETFQQIMQTIVDPTVLTQLQTFH